MIRISYNRTALLALPIDQRRELATDLLDSILIDGANEIPDWKKDFIKDRLQYDKENPNSGTNWEELKAQYLQK